MAEIILITGGSRSGKSAYAQRLGEELSRPRVFVATAPRVDTEMCERIQLHQKAREGKGWETVEEQTDLTSALATRTDAQVVLVDCLTLWVNNLMYQADEQFGETEMQLACSNAIKAAQDRAGTVLFVTNEVGMGIVPEYPASRKYRDLVGRCNQVVASAADRVVLMVSGIRVRVKG